MHHVIKPYQNIVFHGCNQSELIFIVIDKFLLKKQTFHLTDDFLSELCVFILELTFHLIDEFLSNG